MTTPLGALPLDDLQAPPDASERRLVLAPLARAILGHALLVGAAADLLLREGFTGLGFPLWLLVLALSLVSLAWRDGRQMPSEATIWLLVAVLFGAAMAWRSSPSLQFFDFVALLFALGMAAVTLADPRAALLAERARDTVWAAARVLRSVAVGVVPLALRDAALRIESREVEGRLGPAARVLLIVLPLLLVFGALLRDADPIFASIVALPDVDVPRLLSHVVVVGFFAWITAGWARSALLRDAAPRRAPDQLPVSVGALEVTAALGALNALFALYVLTQLGWFFGGERFLQARTGLTAAQYARQGFFQMVWVVLLVLPVLLTTRALLRPGRALERRHTALALPLIGLLVVMIGSAVLRMRLYVHYFGLTLERFYALAFMGWLTIVLVWVALTVLRGRGRLFVAGSVTAGLVLLGALNLVVPDVLVARVDVTRAQAGVTDGGAAPDLSHLASLGGEATPLAVAALLAAPTQGTTAQATADLQRDRCDAATRLLSRWTPSSRDIVERETGEATWRGWNRGDRDAERVVRANSAAVRRVRHEACARGGAARSQRVGR